MENFKFCGTTTRFQSLRTFDLAKPTPNLTGKLMTKEQFRVLSFISVLLVSLLITQFVLNIGNAKLANEVSKQQLLVNRSRQLEPVLDQLAKRLAQDSESNPAFRNLLVKYELRVTSDTNGKQKKYP